MSSLIKLSLTKAMLIFRLQRSMFDIENWLYSYLECCSYVHLADLNSLVVNFG